MSSLESVLIYYYKAIYMYDICIQTIRATASNYFFCAHISFFLSALQGQWTCHNKEKRLFL